MKTTYCFRVCAILAVLFLASTVLSNRPARAEAQATSIVVNTTIDELNADGDCSLREAIQAANSNSAVDACPAGSESDTIFLPAGLYSLTLGPSGEDENLGGDLDISQDLTIIGDSKSTTILDGNASDRVFHVMGSYVQISDITIRNGAIPTGSETGGGAVLTDGDSTLNIKSAVITGNQAPDTYGGAIDNSGNTQLRDVLFTNNSGHWGGAVFNIGVITINNTTFANNTSTQTGGGLDNNSTATIVNTTFSGNSSVNGGGMYNDGQDVFMYNVTFAYNNTAIRNAGNIRFVNTIIAYSTSGVNCERVNSNAVFFSARNNLDSGNTCNFKNPTDLVNIDPRLAPLGDYKGPTPTHTLLGDSPAIDTGTDQDCPTVDQRGARRPADGDENGTQTCDIGAVEFNGTLPSFILMPIISR